MQWIEQPNVPSGGCGIACLAMLLEVPYNRIRDLAPEFCEKCGVEEESVDHVLADHGYAVQRILEYREFDGERRKQWPPRPWAQKHLALVLQNKGDDIAHHVVMDAKGYVLDPADTQHRKVRLSRYYEVWSVAAIILAKRPA